MIIQYVLKYAIIKFFPALATVASLMVFTRLMLPNEFGEYSLTINLTTTFVVILANFLVIGLGRFEPAVKTNKTRVGLHSTVIASAVLISTTLAALIAIMAALGVLPKLSVNYYFFCLLFVISLFLMLNQKLINANLKPKAYGLSLALKNILLLIAGTACLMAGYGIHSVLTSLAIASLLATLPGLSLWARTSWKDFDFRVLRQLWSYGAPLTVLYLFVMIINFSDRIFIDIMLGSEEVGLYSAGYDLTQYTIAIVASIVHLAAFPIILKAYERDGGEKARAFLSASIRILLLVMLPVTLGFIAVKEEVSKIFLGEAFSATSMILIPILALSVLLSTIKSYHFDYAFQISKTTWLQAIPPIFAAFFNCVINYVLILMMGVIGAAYATLVSYALYLALTVLLSGKVFKLPDFPWNYAVKVLMASLLMMLAVIWIEVDLSLIASLLVKAFIGICVFCFCAILFIKKDLVALIKDTNEMKVQKNEL